VDEPSLWATAATNNPGGSPIPCRSAVVHQPARPPAAPACRRPRRIPAETSPASHVRRPPPALQRRGPGVAGRAAEQQLDPLDAALGLADLHVPRKFPEPVACTARWTSRRCGQPPRRPAPADRRSPAARRLSISGSATGRFGVSKASSHSARLFLPIRRFSLDGSGATPSMRFRHGAPIARVVR
jgi:hypothetical protein